jgi:hypothetical protein
MHHTMVMQNPFCMSSFQYYRDFSLSATGFAFMFTSLTSRQSFRFRIHLADQVTKSLDIGATGCRLVAQLVEIQVNIRGCVNILGKDQDRI